MWLLYRCFRNTGLGWTSLSLGPCSLNPKMLSTKSSVSICTINNDVPVYPLYLHEDTYVFCKEKKTLEPSSLQYIESVNAY